MAEMKGIKLCGECGNYDYKKHRCRIGCIDDSNSQASFYGDCPLPDVVPKSEVEKIFDEIEKVILDNTYPDFDSKHKPVNVWKATTGYDAFYELKKKYTEDHK